MKVKLTYFKLTGKYYTCGEYESELTQNDPLFKIWDEIRTMFKEGTAPGLIAYDPDFIASVDVPDHPHNHPRLIIPINKQPENYLKLAKEQLAETKRELSLARDMFNGYHMDQSWGLGQCISAIKSRKRIAEFERDEYREMLKTLADAMWGTATERVKAYDAAVTIIENNKISTRKQYIIQETGDCVSWCPACGPSCKHGKNSLECNKCNG